MAEEISVLEQEVKNIPLSQIEQNENSRVVYKVADLSELMQSMKSAGLLQAVGVKRLGNNKYEAVWGNRRIVAARKLGWKDIPARIVDAETDIDRDVIGLIENLKRQNTTVSEDGRMFQSLVDRGLSIDEIAARVSIARDRVDLALQVFNDIPKEYHKQIKGGMRTMKKSAGLISASAAKSILGIRRRHGLNSKQTRALLDFASKEDVSANQIEHVAPLLKSGLSFASAMKKASGLTRVVLYVYLDSRNIEKLQRKHDKTISDLLWAQLEKDKELGVIRTAGTGANHGTGKMRTLARLTADI